MGDVVQSDMIILGSNENLLGPSPKALEAMQAVSGELAFYARDHDDVLCKKVAASLGDDIKPEQIVLGNGSGDVLRMITQKYVLPGDEVIVPRPTFIAYQRLTNIHRGKLVEVPLLDDYQIDLDGILAAVTDRTKLIFICNPNNPTGLILKHDAMVDFLDKVPDHVITVVDEAYYDFCADPDFPRMSELVAAGYRVIVARTFSKVYGLAGMRVGFGFGRLEELDPINQTRHRGEIGRMAYAGAGAALTDEEHIVNTIEMVRQGREYLYEQFDKLGLNYLRSHAFFVLLNDLPIDAQLLVDEMEKHNVVVRHTDVFNMPNHVRFSIGRQADNEAAVAALQAVLLEQGGSKA